MGKKVWIKGELMDTLDSASIDPRHHLERKSGRPLFERLDWFSRIMPTLQGATPLVVRSWHEGQMAWLFLAQSGRQRATALANWYSFAWRPVMSEAMEDAQKEPLLIAAARRLLATRGGPVEVLLAPVPRADGTSELVSQCFRKAGWRVLAHQSSTSWTASVTGLSFADYWSQRPGALRSTHDRKLKKFGVETRVVDHFDPAIWDAYDAIYQDSWKPREGDMNLLRTLAEDEGHAGCLRMGIATLEGRPVAAQFWTVEHGVAYIHKLAHREDAKESSAGTILSAALFRHVIDSDHVDSIDFGTGNDRYKADWMDTSHPLDTLRLYNIRHPLGLYRYARARISALVHGKRLD